MKANLAKGLKNSISRKDKSSIILIELPSDVYFSANSETIKLLTGMGYEGVYISFNRPYGNVSSLLLKSGVDMEKLFFIDAATRITDIRQKDSKKCISIMPTVEIDELVRATYTSLEKLKSEKLFIYIDSLATMALYKPLSETMRFSEFIKGTLERHSVQKITLIINVPIGLAQSKFLKEVAFNVDEVITIPK